MGRLRKVRAMENVFQFESKIGQNKWVCGANQMVCLEKFFLEGFEPAITRSCSFQDITSPFLAYTRCQDFGLGFSSYLFH